MIIDGACGQSRRTAQDWPLSPIALLTESILITHVQSLAYFDVLVTSWYGIDPERSGDVRSTGLVPVYLYWGQLQTEFSIYNSGVIRHPIFTTSHQHRWQKVCNLRIIEGMRNMTKHYCLAAQRLCHGFPNFTTSWTAQLGLEARWPAWKLVCMAELYLRDGLSRLVTLKTDVVSM